MARIRSLVWMRRASAGLMPIPTSPAYSGWWLSNVSWKRKALPTGSLQFSANRCKACAACTVQPPPPAITSGRSDASSKVRKVRREPGSLQACTASTRGSAWGTVPVTACGRTGAVSMSSGSTSTTGPGRPFMAVAKARATYSGMRATSSIRSTRLAMPLVLGPKKLP